MHRILRMERSSISRLRRIEEVSQIPVETEKLVEKGGNDNAKMGL